MSQEFPIVLDEEEEDVEYGVDDQNKPTMNSPVVIDIITPATVKRQESPQPDSDGSSEYSAISLESPEKALDDRVRRHPIETLKRQHQECLHPDEFQDDDILQFSWRRGVEENHRPESVPTRGVRSESLLKTVTELPRASTEPFSSTQLSEEDALKKKKKAKKGGKTEAEKLEIAVALGKHRHLEVKAVVSPTFGNGSIGTSFEYFLVENERASNLLKDSSCPDDLLYFRRHLLELTPEGIVAPVGNQYFVERVAIIIWDGLQLVTDIKEPSLRAARSKSVKDAKEYIQVERQACLASDATNIIVAIIDCDSAIASTRLPLKVLEDFLVFDLEILHGVSYIHVKTISEVAELMYSHFCNVERWPFRKEVRGTDFLDHVKRLKSFSTCQDLAPGQRAMNRELDGTQLLGIWTNQLQVIPRLSRTIAEGIAESFPSIRALTTALEESPAETEDKLSQARGEVRRERKLAKTIRLLFTCNDPEEVIA